MNYLESIFQFPAAGDFLTIFLIFFFFCLISLYNHEIIETGFMLNSRPILAKELSGQALESDILASQLASAVFKLCQII